MTKEAPAPAQMLALRVLANMFSTERGEELLRTYRDSVLKRWGVRLSASFVFLTANADRRAVSFTLAE